jgi:hypothetical protein
MRRLISLVPALTLLLALAPAAHANTPASSQTSWCANRTSALGTVTATATWTDTADPSQHLLTGATVNDQCQKLWVRLWFRSSRTAPGNFYVWVQPGAVQTLGQSKLVSFGIYQQPFFKWSIHVGWEGQQGLTPDCSDARGAVGFILADGSILAC